MRKSIAASEKKAAETQRQQEERDALLKNIPESILKTLAALHEAEKTADVKACILMDQV